MFDGVGWAATEIVVFLLMATLLGFAIGWILGRWSQKGTVSEEFEGQAIEEREHARRIETRLNDRSRQLTEAQLLLRGREEMLSKLELELESAKVASTHPGSGVAGPDGKDAEIARLSAELTTLDSDRDRLAEEVARLEGAVSGKEARIVALEDDLDAATQPEAVVQADLTAHVEPVAATAESAADPSKEEGLARIAAIAARTAGGGPSIDDDLKKVHGIGPKIERMLKDLGITSFRQIANFQGEEIAHITAALDGFKGRIERDDWMGSAADEHARKYGKPT